MTQPIRAALLPLYLKLYDDVVPDMRARVEAFADTINERFGAAGLDMVRLPVCRIADEFREAITKAEREGAEALVTLHLAYSPSLESADALAGTSLPVVVCDTTPTFEFGPSQSAKEIMTNHGIHGVQDMCNLLRRNGKPFAIEAGHHEHSDVITRTVEQVRAAAAAHRMRTARVGRIGEPFAGMGDFAVEADVLQRTIGTETVPTSPTDIARHLPDVDDPAVAEELRADRERFDCSQVTEEEHLLTVQTCLAVRRWLEQQHLSAFTVNFLEITRANKLPVMPFLEASKGMSRGLGYAGEGDVLTAALVGALASTFGETSFTEMFCPAWKENCIFLSHMGEINLDLTAAKPVLQEKAWNYTDADAPVVAYAAFKPGPATFVDLAPGPNETYTLIVAPVEMVLDGDDSNFAGSIRGWFRPSIPLLKFLQQYSRAGGTHHAAVVYGDTAGLLGSMAGHLGWGVVRVG